MAACADVKYWWIKPSLRRRFISTGKVFSRNLNKVTLIVLLLVLASLSRLPTTRVCNRPASVDYTKYNYDKLFLIAKSLLKYENPLVDQQLIADYSNTFNVLPRNIVPYDDKIIKSTWRRMEPYIHEIAKSGLNLNLDLSFGSLDEAVIWSMARQINPKLIIEIGAGFSTMIFDAARRKIKEENNLSINHVAIEPYRSDVIKALQGSVDIKVNVIQQVDAKFFDRLQENDILFIDNSHVVQPYGDVIYEMLYILPRLKKGVWVHIHDIFIPHDYPPSWYKQNRSYTEQYFVAAFLHKNNDWEVMFPVHYAAKFVLRDEISSKGLSLGGGSLWLRKIN